MTLLIRVALFLLFIVELVVGGWNQLWPASFYLNFPTVDQTPPFSEHYARDFGGATLGIALLLAIAVVKPAAHFVVPAAAAYSLFSVPHFFFHLEHLEHATPAEAVLLTAGNAIVAILGILAMVLVLVRDRRARRVAPAEREARLV